MTDRYLDDLSVGESWTGEPFTMTEAEIVAFARQFDPQPMHVDKAAAEAGRFGGLIASGWHVCSRVMRQFVDEAYFGQTPLLGMNVDALWWVRPVRGMQATRLWPCPAARTVYSVRLYLPSARTQRPMIESPRRAMGASIQPGPSGIVPSTIAR